LWGKDDDDDDNFLLIFLVICNIFSRRCWIRILYGCGCGGLVVEVLLMGLQYVYAPNDDKDNVDPPKLTFLGVGGGVVIFV